MSNLTNVFHLLLRWGCYPVVFGLCTAAQLLLLALRLPHWPWAPLIACSGLACVALLERLRPFEPKWLADHGDTMVDLLHAAFSLTLIFLSLELVALVESGIAAMGWTPASWHRLWPRGWPLWAQVLAAGAVIDFGLWLVHWLSHKLTWLWRLHALHHSAERLYWLNGERRHPLSALAHAAPSVLALALLGVAPEIVGCWFSIVAVHLAFQHANLDYTLGPLRRLLGVAEIHRWHHKREYNDAQVNFGEFWMLWDHLFGTFRDSGARVGARDVGLDHAMPSSYIGQLAWPFRRRP
jgi:sterol desaturase/sphingolipid hydroxylase (fatty acid hydroxylase superfamily)